jgi:hypothetical protein
MCGCKNKQLSPNFQQNIPRITETAASGNYSNTNLFIKKKLSAEEIRVEFLKRLNAGTAM